MGSDKSNSKSDKKYRKTRETEAVIKRDIRDEVEILRTEIRNTRDSMLQSLSLLIGFIGVIFAVIIGAAFQPNVLFNPNPAIIGLLSLVVAMAFIWFICNIYRWLKKTL